MMTFMGQRRWWVADLHIGHAKVADLRGFTSVREHDTAILGQLAEVEGDEMIWVLGDISSGKPDDEAAALSMLGDMVSADMHLIAGNHDSVSSVHRRGHIFQREWLEVFESVQQFGRVRLHGKNVMMSHYPYARSGDGPDRGEGRYMEYRLPDVGLPLIHGHTHQPEPHIPKWEFPGSGWVDRSQFCVSWDAHRGLVTEHALNQWIEGMGP